MLHPFPSQFRTLSKKFGSLANERYRWAAKEAARKAHTWRELKLHDITILGNQHRGIGASVAPTMTVRTKDRTGLQVVKFSISHDGGYATAVCLAAEDTEDSEPRLEIDKEDDIVHKT